MEESIYNLIPKEYIPGPKEKMYKSKFPHDLRPTGTTFTNHTTSRPGVANLNGDFHQQLGPHSHQGRDKTFGKPKQSNHLDKNQYLKKTQGISLQKDYQSQFIEQSKKMKEERDQKQKKQKVPLKDDKPIMGLKSNKNYIIANAVQNILAAPKQEPEKEDYLKKKNYGQIPEYLNKINQKINQEYQVIRELQQQESNQLQNQKYQLSDQERVALKEGLTRKWEAVNKEYQSITHIKIVDTVGLKRKKQDCEKEMAQLEKDISILNRATIFVNANS